MKEQVGKQAVEAAEAQAKAAQVEKAWEVLLSAGAITPEDRTLLEHRAKDRKILALASETLAKAQEWGVVSVTLVTSTTIYVAEENEPPRLAPRVSTPTRQRKASGAKSPEDKASEAKGSDDIPPEYLKRASDQLGLKWFGPSNAARSKRVVELARKIASGQA